MTAAALSSPAPRRRRAAGRLRVAATACLAMVPLAMAVANRSAPLLVTLSAAAALGASLAEGGGPALADHLRGALRAPLGVAAAMFLSLAIASVAWSPRPDLSLNGLGEFALPLGAALLLALALPKGISPGAPLLLAACVGAACAVILADLATDLGARRLLGLRAESFIHNRPALTLLVLLPALVALARSDDPPSWRRPALLAAAALAAVTILASDSAAATLGLACGVVAYAAARLAPRLTLGLTAGGIALALLAAPVLGEMAEVGPPAMHRLLEGAHTQERVEIWRSFGAAAREQPLLGAGFGVSPRLHETPIAEAVAPERRTLLAAGHPHNAALQIWVELGLAGALLALVTALLVLKSLAALPAERLAPALALFAAVAAVSLVGHGAWQGWWPAAIGAAIVWLRVADARRAAA